jgi:hypothetical protein
LPADRARLAAADDSPVREVLGSARLGDQDKGRQAEGERNQLPGRGCGQISESAR